jgi:hypothetical protein
VIAFVVTARLAPHATANANTELRSIKLAIGFNGLGKLLDIREAVVNTTLRTRLEVVRQSKYLRGNHCVTKDVSRCIAQ